MKKLGLALGSGGARGVAHIGFLQALDDNGIKPQYISGCSMGSVVGSCYAFGMRPADMMDAVRNLKVRDLLDPNIAAIRQGTLLKSKKLLAVLKRFLGHTTFDQLRIPFSCVGADIVSGEKVVFDSGEVAPAVQVSSSIPLVFQPVEIDGKIVCDGGVVCRVPIEEVQNLGAEVVVAVDVLGPLRPNVKVNGLLRYLLRIIDVYDNNITNRNRKEHPCDIYIAPDLGDISQYKIDRANFEICYKKGYECAMSIMDDIKKLIAD